MLGLRPGPGVWLGMGLLEQLREQLLRLELLREKGRQRSRDVLGDCSSGVLATF